MSINIHYTKTFPRTLTFLALVTSLKCLVLLFWSVCNLLGVCTQWGRDAVKPALTSCSHLQVPVGTFFRDMDGNVIADLQHAGDSFLAARGGCGGRGNYFFLSNDNRAPTSYEEGGRGEDKVVYAELRVIADIGMVNMYLWH